MIFNANRMTKLKHLAPCYFKFQRSFLLWVTSSMCPFVFSVQALKMSNTNQAREERTLRSKARNLQCKQRHLTTHLGKTDENSLTSEQITKELAQT